jgi:DNA-binding NarL/FixJ family response regulator
VNRHVRLLVADFALIRLGVRVALEEAAVDICAEADNAPNAIRAAGITHPDVCLVGQDLPGGVLVAIRGILERSPTAAVVVLAESVEPDQLIAAVRSGAIGFVAPPVEAAQLGRVVRAAADGEAIVPRRLVRELVPELHRSSALVVDNVTPRESEVLEMLGRGFSTLEIARKLAISPITVRRHTSDLVRKTGVEDRAALVRSQALAEVEHRVIGEDRES